LGRRRARAHRTVELEAVREPASRHGEVEETPRAISDADKSSLRGVLEAAHPFGSNRAHPRGYEHRQSALAGKSAGSAHAGRSG